MRSTPVRLSHVILFLIVSIILLVVGAFALKNFATQQIGQDEFTINYTATKNWISENRSPYDVNNGLQLKNLQEAKDENIDIGGLFYFRHPLMTTLLILPFTLLPLEVAKASWMVFSIACLVTGSLIMIALKGQKASVWTLATTGVFSALNFFSVYTIATGNLLPQLFLIIMIVLLLLKSHNDIFAGFIGTCALMLFQFGLITVIYLNVWASKGKRKSFITSFWAAFAFELAMSLIIFPTWIRGWLGSLLQDVNGAGQYASLLSHLIGINHPDTLWINLLLHIGLLLLLFASASSFSFKNDEGLAWMVSLIMLVSSLIAFPDMPGVQVLCLPALIMVINVWMTRWVGYGKTFFWISILALFIIPWIVCLISETEIFIYIQGVLYALVGLLGLWWIRWWMIRPRY
jgi:hypothetical protein